MNDATQARELVRVFRGSPGPTERAASVLQMKPAEVWSFEHYFEGSAWLPWSDTCA